MRQKLRLPLLLSSILYVLPTHAVSDLISAETVKANANRIDAVIARNLKKNKITPPGTTDDATFMRRAFLVAVGRIPNPAEAMQFIELDHPNKREMLINYLYSSEGYKSHMINWFYDLFTIREMSGNAGSERNHQALIDWARNAAETNMAWDQMCKELLTSKGNAFTGSGAEGYFAKGDAIDDHLSNTLRIFTGVRMECAQCHDDPFQEWEQMDFYQLKAFVHGDTSYDGKTNLDAVRGKIKKLPRDGYRHGRPEIMWFRANAIVQFGVKENKGTGYTKLPHDYKYKDGRPGQVVYGRTPFGAKLKLKNKDPKALDYFAKWMTSDQTEHFAITIANRLWERVMGISLTPVTGDYVDPEDTNFETLILTLAKIIKDYDYDMRAFQQTLMSTRAFQFTSSNKNLQNGAKDALDGRRANRMTAEQLWDSIVSLSVNNPDDLTKRKPSSPYFVYGGQVICKKAELVNNTNTMSVDQYYDWLVGLHGKMDKGQLPRANHQHIDEAMPMMGSARFTSRNRLRRASELPTPSGGFLATFGQSARGAAIDEASKEGTVTQALELLNGLVQKLVVEERQSSVNNALQSVKGEEERIRLIFLVTLNRVPEAEELKYCREYVAKSTSKSAGYSNIISGLVASQEFYFIF